jgi:hypothetical protein
MGTGGPPPGGPPPGGPNGPPGGLNGPPGRPLRGGPPLGGPPPGGPPPPPYITFPARAFFRFVVLSTRTVRELYGLFHLHLVDPAGQALLPGIMPPHRRLRGPLLG